MVGQGCAGRGHGYGPRVVRRVCHVIPSQVVPEGVGEWPEQARVAGGGGGAAGAAGRARWWGLRSPQWGQWVRRCAAPRQNQWSGLQGRAVCGSRWRTQRCSGWRLAVPVGGRWRGGVGAGSARMLVGVCAVPVLPVCAVPSLFPVEGV